MKTKLILLVMVLTLFSTSCASKKAEANATPLMENTIVKLEDFSFEFLDGFLVKSANDVVKDSIDIYEKISDYEIEVDSVQLGFDIGFTGANSDVKKRDGFLVLILKYNPDGAITSQRDSIIPEMIIKASDDKSENLILVHNSLDEKYIQIENPEGVLIFKTFADAKTVTVTFDGSSYLFTLN